MYTAPCAFFSPIILFTINGGNFCKSGLIEYDFFQFYVVKERIFQFFEQQ